MTKLSILLMLLICNVFAYVSEKESYNFLSCDGETFSMFKSEIDAARYPICGITFVCHEPFDKNKSCRHMAVIEHVVVDSTIYFVLKPLLPPNDNDDENENGYLQGGFVGIRHKTGKIEPILCADYVDYGKTKDENKFIFLDTAEVYHVPNIKYCLTDLYTVKNHNIKVEPRKQNLNNYLKEFKFNELIK